MRFLNLSLLATGAVYRSELLRPADLEPTKLRACRALLSVESTKAPLPVAGWEDLVLRQTLSEGMGLATVWRGEHVASAAILLAGTDVGAEAGLLDIFYDSNARMYAKVMLGASEAPYAEFHIEERRPAVFQVIWPMIPEAEYGRVEAVAGHFGAAFFQALGVERDAGDR
jgi:hypothetical protein